MTAPTIYSLRNSDGRTIWRGTISPAPGGGSQPAIALYSGNSVDVSDGNSHGLTFDNLGDGTDLLDRTDPANPLVLAAGLYLLISGYSFAGIGAALVDVQVVFGASTYFSDVNTPAVGQIVSMAPLAAGDAINVVATLAAPTPGAGGQLSNTTLCKLS